ncbi:MAG: hypothetical protein QOI10_1928 [Solirubrobacterales bacterium]|jgi:hypothetical protein|nr:hypothetical protein [Solirubrobacterales bacterium]
MGMFDIGEETEREYTEKFRALAQEKVGEPVIAVGPFRRGGAAAGMAISHAGLGGIVYAANSLFNKKKAGGLPQRVFLVVTPTKIHAFKWDIKGRNYKLKDEAAVWERPGLRFSTASKMGLTMLTIEAPAEGEKVTLAPAGVKDDPWTQEVMRVLQADVTEVPA